ncbi:hypothetical protein RvY_05005-2 [Ramazzottius varieornatus]|nr:hypothetical protein RvY_05005-2 [Ramazzottius varieornatus]
MNSNRLIPRQNMRVFSGLEWGLMVISTVQLMSGITLLVINTILINVENILIWGYYESESIFGRDPVYNFTLVTCALFVLGLVLACCGLFGLCSVFLWRQRTTFIILYLFCTLVSLACIGVVLYVVFDVVGHQRDRVERFKEYYHNIVFKDYASDPQKREYFDHVQKSGLCCGFAQARDWLVSPLGYIPSSCCRFPDKFNCLHLGTKPVDINTTQLSLEEAFQGPGCFVKQEHRENSMNAIAYLFYGGLTSSAIILQLTG